jgi:hypothetical protein
VPGISVDIKRLLLANAMTPLAGNQPLVDAIQKHAQAVIGEPVPAVGTPLYTDVRLYVERGIPGVIYGAGPRTVLESHAKRADERLDLEDLRRATKVIARGAIIGAGVISILIAPVVSRMLRFFPAGGHRHHHRRDRHQPDARGHQLDLRQPGRPHGAQIVDPEHADGG